MILLRRAIPLILLALASTTHAAERRYSITDFDKIRVVGASRVIITTGRATTVRASADRDALDQLSIESLDRTLTIQPVGGTVATDARALAKPTTIYITLPLLSTAKLNGPGSISIAALRGIQTDVSLTGSGQISVAKVMADNLNARLSGSGTLTLAGRALKVDANIKGSGSVAASSLNVADLKLMAASSGTIAMSASRAAMVTSTGSGTVTIAGGPSCTVQNIGVGTVTCGKAP
ncbi:MAG: head GIN domain-containing protein [Pseudomonadota bacterium]